MTVPFVPTHAAPATGLDTWDEPDATKPAGPWLSGGLPVQQVEQWGAWTKVACSNGWVAWVDGRQLQPLAVTAPPPPPPPPPAPAAPPAPTAPPAPAAPAAPTGSRPLDRSPIKVGGFTLGMSLVGTAAAVASCFLPWFSINGQGQTAFKIPVRFLVDYKSADPSGIKLGVLLLVLAAGAVGLTLRPVSNQARKAIGWILLLVASVFVAQTQRSVGQLSSVSVFSVLGLGVYVAAAGGALIAMSKGES